MSNDYDSAWKEALHRYLQLAIELFFPAIAQSIDWTKGHEFLDTELRQLFSDGQTPDRQADVLVRVTLLDGQESWVLIHAEVQNQKEDAFAKRMFCYHYRLVDRFDVPVCSLAIFGDDSPDWRPTSYETNTLGCHLNFKFPTVKLNDLDPQELEENLNPFSLVALAQVRANKAPFGSESRYQHLFSLVRQLYQRGMTGPEIRSFYELLDWVLRLSPQQTLQFRQELANYEQEFNMAHVSSLQQLGRDEGRVEGRVEGQVEAIMTVLDSRFGMTPAALREKLMAQSSDFLVELTRLAAVTDSLKEFLEQVPDK